MINLHSTKIKASIAIILLIFLFVFQKNNLNTTTSTINIFLSSILPSLFPFILFSNLLIYLNIIPFILSFCGKFRYLACCILTGFLCGYPMGAKITYSYYLDNKITLKELYFLMSFINNCNPIFILSTIGICVLNNFKFGLVLCISHYLSSIVIGIYNFTHNNIIHEISKKSNILSNNKDKILHKSLFDIISSSIASTYVVLGNIFAYILISNLLYSNLSEILYLFKVNRNVLYLLSGFFESIGGIKTVYANIHISEKVILPIISFYLGFSGISIIFQIYSCIYKSDISIYKIFKYKLIQGCLSMALTYCLLNFNNITNINFSFNIFNNISYFILGVSFLFILVFTIRKATHTYK